MIATILFTEESGSLKDCKTNSKGKKLDPFQELDDVNVYHYQFVLCVAKKAFDIVSFSAILGFSSYATSNKFTFIFVNKF